MKQQNETQKQWILTKENNKKEIIPKILVQYMRVWNQLVDQVI